MSWRQKEEEKKERKKTPAVALLSAPTLRNILQHDEVHPSEPPPKELRPDPRSRSLMETKLPGSGPGALVSQTLFAVRRRKTPSFQRT